MLLYTFTPHVRSNVNHVVDQGHFVSRSLRALRQAQICAPISGPGLALLQFQGALVCSYAPVWNKIVKGTAHIQAEMAFCLTYPTLFNLQGGWNKSKISVGDPPFIPAGNGL